MTKANLAQYPFTAVEIGLRTIALFLSLTLLLSLIEKKYFLKAGIALAASALGILYAIQQIATAARVTPIQWTLSFAYAGLILPLAIIYYLVRGIVEGIYQGLTKDKRSQTATTELKGKDKESASEFWSS